VNDPVVPERARPILKLRWWIPALTGAIYGLVVRICIYFFNGYSNDVEIVGPMLIGFLFVMPFAIGALAVYVGERDGPRGVGWHLLAALLATLLCMAGTAALLLEGAICLVMALPLFLVLGQLGALVMIAICRWRPRPTRTMQGLAMLPLVVMALEAPWPNPVRVGEVRTTVHIDASPDIVWQQVVNATGIRTEEVPDCFVYLIGLPKPVAGTTLDTPDGRIRRSQWHKGVQFDEVITTWEPSRRLAWRYRFGPDSFPPHALDDHVRIGGRYFGMEDTDFEFRPSHGGTDLTVTLRYRVSTHFNWYSEPLARWMLADASRSMLTFYTNRSERAAAEVDVAAR
jgi:hypothetical protein